MDEDPIKITTNRFVLKSDCVKELNKQVNSELHASLVYFQMVIQLSMFVLTKMFL